MASRGWPPRWAVLAGIGLVTVIIAGYASLTFLSRNTYFRPLAYRDEVPHEVLIGELVRVGAARVLEGGQYLRVQKRTYIPTDMTAEMIQIFSQAVRRYIETVDYNLGRGKHQEKRFDRMVYPDGGLSVVDVEIFQEEIREYLETVIQEIDQKSSTYPRPERRKNEEAVQVGVGLYFYQEVAETHEPLTEAFKDLEEFANDDFED